jgi:hypothetical protein
VRFWAFLITAVALVDVAVAVQPLDMPVSLLGIGPRSSIVVELPDAVAGVIHVNDRDPGVYVVDFGPMAATVTPARFEAGPHVHLIQEVVLSSVSLSTGGSALRVQVKHRAPASRSVRLEGRRGYVDFTAQTEPGSPTLASVRQPASVGATKDLLGRAEFLAQVPDVKKLEALRRDLLRYGNSEPDASARPPGERRDATLTQLDGYIAQARQRQLAVDARLLRQEQTDEYRGQLRSAAAALDRMERALQPRQPGLDPVPALEEAAAEVALRFRSLEAPAELVAAHARLRTHAQEIARAVAALRETPRHLRAARTPEASAAITRARTAVTEALAFASSR